MGDVHEVGEACGARKAPEATVQDKIERKRLAILGVLKEAGHPLGSRQITERLNAHGYDMSERTVRFHLLAMDKEGLTRYVEKHGRRLTTKGFQETINARVHERVGFLSVKIDQLSYEMDFDLSRRSGSVIVNVSLIRETDIWNAVPLISRVYEKGFSMGALLGLFKPGERVGEMVVPQGYVGVGTVCWITLNGVLLAHGIPVDSRFGGLMEIRNNRAVRFVAIITYDGTSIDPLEIFVKSGMTDYLGATGAGNGLIGAGFREIPAAARDQVRELAADLNDAGLGGFLEIGAPGRPVAETPVSDGNVGLVAIGGLNPIAIIEEAGFEVHSRALSGLVPYERLFNHVQFGDQVERLAGPKLDGTGTPSSASGAT